MVPLNAWGSLGSAQTGLGTTPQDLINLGGVVLQPVFQDVKVDPFDGTAREFRFRGPEANVNAAQPYALANGWQSRIETNNTPWPELIVTIPNPGESEFTVRWQYTTEFKQQDIFINIGFVNYLQNEGLTIGPLLDAKANLTNLLNNNVTYSTASNPAANPTYPFLPLSGPELAVYQFMLMGGQYVEVAQPVIARDRTYAIGYTGPTMATLKTQTVWSTSALVAAFAIPAAVSEQITADPTTAAIANFAYGWKQRKNELTIIPAKNKITERLDWVWDQWSLLAYNFI